MTETHTYDIRTSKGVIHASHPGAVGDCPHQDCCKSAQFPKRVTLGELRSSQFPDDYIIYVGYPGEIAPAASFSGDCFDRYEGAALLIEAGEA